MWASYVWNLERDRLGGSRPCRDDYRQNILEGWEADLAKHNLCCHAFAPFSIIYIGAAYDYVLPHQQDLALAHL